MDIIAPLHRYDKDQRRKDPTRPRTTPPFFSKLPQLSTGTRKAAYRGGGVESTASLATITTSTIRNTEITRPTLEYDSLRRLALVE